MEWKGEVWKKQVDFVYSRGFWKRLKDIQEDVKRE